MPPKKITNEMTREELFKEINDLRQQIKDMKKIQKIEESRREKENRQRYFSLLNAIADPVFIYDAATYRFLHCNDAATARYGYSREEFLDMTPFDLHKSEDFVILRQNIDRSNVDMPITYTHIAKDRRQRQVEITTEEFYFDGNPAWLSVAHDITERIIMEAELERHRSQLEEMVNERTMEVLVTNKKLHQEILEREKGEQIIRESEVKFRNLIEKSLDGIILVDESGTVIEWNQGQENIYALPRSSAVGSKIWDIQFQHEPGASREEEKYLEIKSRWETFFLTGGNPFQNNPQVSKIERTDGKLRDIQQIYFTIETEKGTMMGCTTRDITADLAMERQLIQGQKMEAMGTLAGGIAHDFNNILGGIMGYTELALRKTDESLPVYNYLKQVMTASNRAKDLVRQILTFSRREDLQRKPVKIGLIVKEVLKLLRSSLPATIEIISKIEAEDRFVMADPTQVHQVLMNLFTNSAHAMQEKGGILEIRLSEEQVETGIYKGLNAGPYIRLSINDTGHGIKTEHLDKIFEPFFTTKKPGKGTGMGLAVVHSIVESHGGHISVFSKEGEGTTFSILLPITLNAIHLKEEDGEMIEEGNERILLVEDDPQLIEAEKNLLTEIGYQVTALKSSVEAVELFKRLPDRFDIVITDYTMPRLTGFQLARKIHALRPEIPIILCTGYSELVTPQKASSQGIFEVIMKPIDLGQIARSIRKALKSIAEKEPAGDKPA